MTKTQCLQGMKRIWFTANKGSAPRSALGTQMNAIFLLPEFYAPTIQHTSTLPACMQVRRVSRIQKFLFAFISVY